MIVNEYHFQMPHHRTHEIFFLRRRSHSPPSRLIATVGGEGLLWYLRPRIQSICANLYPANPAAEDDILCDGILRDSLDPGVINVMISGSKHPPPRTANELLGAEFGSSINNEYNRVQTRFSETIFDGCSCTSGIFRPSKWCKRSRRNVWRKLSQMHPIYMYMWMFSNIYPANLLDWIHFPFSI